MTLPDLSPLSQQARDVIERACAKKGVVFVRRVCGIGEKAMSNARHGRLTTPLTRKKLEAFADKWLELEAEVKRDA